jgi:poly-gamma-glutamate synthesis protein (capsule biosynthesis protein)
VLKLTLRGTTVVEHDLVPALMSKTGQPVPMTGAAAEAELERFAELRDCAELRSRPNAA